MENRMKIHKTLKIPALLSLLFILTVTNFAQVDVARQTTAITYPQDEVVLVQFRGTDVVPRMKGEAKIERTKKTARRLTFRFQKCRARLNSAPVTRLTSFGQSRRTVKSII